MTPPADPQGNNHKPSPRHRLFRFRTPGLRHTWIQYVAPKKTAGTTTPRRDQPRCLPPVSRCGKHLLPEDGRHAGGCTARQGQSCRPVAGVFHRRHPPPGARRCVRASSRVVAHSVGVLTQACGATRVQSGQLNARRCTRWVWTTESTRQRRVMQYLRATLSNCATICNASRSSILQRPSAAGHAPRSAPERQPSSRSRSASTFAPGASC